MYRIHAESKGALNYAYTYALSIPILLKSNPEKHNLKAMPMDQPILFSLPGNTKLTHALSNKLSIANANMRAIGAKIDPI